MSRATRICWTLAVILGVIALAGFGAAPWLHGPDSARMFGSAFVVALAAVGALLVGIGADTR
jgi:peptidoglycan/LPS O-acetylase OafA/YrhL